MKGDVRPESGSDLGQVGRGCDVPIRRRTSLFGDRPASSEIAVMELAPAQPAMSIRRLPGPSGDENVRVQARAGGAVDRLPRRRWKARSSGSASATEPRMRASCPISWGTRAPKGIPTTGSGQARQNAVFRLRRSGAALHRCPTGMRCDDSRAGVKTARRRVCTAGAGSVHAAPGVRAGSSPGYACPSTQASSPGAPSRPSRPAGAASSASP